MYQKHNFVDDQTLYARHLNEMDEQIAKNESDIEDLAADVYTKEQSDQRYARKGEGGSAAQDASQITYKNTTVEAELTSLSEEIGALQGEVERQETANQNIQNALAGKQPTGDYATRTELQNGLNGKQPAGNYPTKTEMEQAIAAAQLGGNDTPVVIPSDASDITYGDSTVADTLDTLTDGVEVVNDNRVLTKDEMLELVQHPLIGSGTVKYDEFVVRSADTLHRISPVGQVKYMNNPVYQAGKLPSECINPQYPDRKNQTYWDSTYKPAGYHHAINIGGVYALDASSLPDEFNLYLGRMGMWTLGDSEDAVWELHEQRNYPVQFTRYSFGGGENYSLSDRVEKHDEYVKLTLTKDDLADNSYIHYWGRNTKDIDCEHTDSMLVCYEVWSDVPVGNLFCTIAVDQRVADDGSSPKQLFSSRNLFVQNEPSYIIGHNISDATYERQVGTLNSPERVFENWVPAYRGGNPASVFPLQEAADINGQDMVNLGVLSWKDEHYRHLYAKQVTEKGADGKYIPRLQLAAYYDSKNNPVRISGVADPVEDDDAVSKKYVKDNMLKGDPGADGKSAYQVAVDNGYVGSEAQWISSLQGEKGDMYYLTNADRVAIANIVIGTIANGDEVMY